MFNAQINAIIGIVLLAVIVGVYFKGRADGTASVKIDNYKQQIKEYEESRDRSLEAFKEAEKIQRIDFENALKNSEQRQAKRLDNIERAGTLQNQLLKQRESIGKCVLNDETLKTLNESLRGSKK